MTAPTHRKKPPAPADGKSSPRVAARSSAPQKGKHFAIVGAGMAGVACARTLVQAGHRVTVFEKLAQAGGRTFTMQTPHGGFDAGAQYFTVRDHRFAKALDTIPGLCKPWSASSIRVLDATGCMERPGLPSKGEAHWVASPGMQNLVLAWAAPLLAAQQLHTRTSVRRIEHDPMRDGAWQLRTESADGGQRIHAGFDAVLLAIPAIAAQALLAASALETPLSDNLQKVAMAPCWTLMLAYPQAVRPGVTTLGPQWNAARSTHHRIAWLARESSKPGRKGVERWTVQASPAWSAEHLQDDAARIEAKLLKAFAEITGIRAQPGHTQTHLWPYAQTTHPMGHSHDWDARLQLGVCGDWCLGHRLEDAFVSGLELALKVA